MKTNKINVTPVQTTNIPFHAQDEKGRWLGCAVYTNEVEFVPVTDGRDCYYTQVEPGRYFEAVVQATKDGKSWGAAQPTKRFATREEQREYTKQRVAASRKAAEKKAVAA